MSKLNIMNESPFLKNRDRLIENSVGFVIYDSYPVSKGHCLIIPHRIYSNYSDSTAKEIEGLQELLFEAKNFLDNKFSPDGYNVGINCEASGGQTVSHVHIHLIPRYDGDIDDPRGGVRGVIPSKQKY